MINTQGVSTAPRGGKPHEEAKAIRAKIYNSTRWRKIRTLHLQANPLCEECKRQGRITPAEEVHHIVSFMSVQPAKRIEVAYDLSNLESICKVCHQKEHHGRGRGSNF